MEQENTQHIPQGTDQLTEKPADTPVSSSQKPKKDFSLIIILSFATIIASLIAAFFYFQNMKLKTELSKNIEATRTPLPTETPKENKEWKTYTNEDFNFSFHFPNEAKLIEEDCISLQIIGPTQTQETEAFDGLYLNFCPETLVDQTISEWIENDASGDIQLIKPKTEYEIKNYTAYSYETLGLMQEKNILIQSPYLESEIVVIRDITQDPTGQGYKEIVDEIISSFEFLD